MKLNKEQQAILNRPRYRKNKKNGRIHKHPLIDNEKEFWLLVQKNEPNECWPWLGPKEENRYGNKVTLNKKYDRPHRHAYMLSNYMDNIPNNLVVMHSCDFEICCNPNHLSLGTHKDNAQDMVQKGRRVHASKVGILNGRSKLTEENVIEIIDLLNQGESTIDIASIYNVSNTIINNIYNRRTWTHITDSKLHTGPRRNRKAERKMNTIIQLRQQGLSHQKIAQITKCHRETVRRILKKAKTTLNI